MARVLPIAVALSAVLFMAFARPQEQPEPTQPAPAIPANPACDAYQQQCNMTGSGPSQLPGGMGGIVGTFPVGGDMMNQTSARCQELEKTCKNPGAGGMPVEMPTNNGTMPVNPPAMPALPATNGTMPNNGTMPVNPPAMPTLPATNGTMPNMTMPVNPPPIPAIPAVPGIEMPNMG